jgi:hypothetical protein
MTVQLPTDGWAALGLLAIAIALLVALMPPKVECTVVAQANARNDTLRIGMPSAAAYRPPLGFASPHAQIIGTSSLRVRPNLTFKREALALDDGGGLALDWLGPPATPGTFFFSFLFSFF